LAKLFDQAGFGEPTIIREGVISRGGTAVPRRRSVEEGLVRGAPAVILSRVWSAYPESDPRRPAEPAENALPGRAPNAPAGLDPVELVVDGQTFVVTRRADAPGTYEFAWTSHPASYGFSVGSNTDWEPDRAELAEEIRCFLAEIDPETGYLRD
jgi:hypothetical protein